MMLRSITLLLIPTVRAGVLQLTGNSNAIDFGDGANRLTCRPQTFENPSIRSIYPRSVTSMTANVSADLVGIAPSCAGRTIREPCASDRPADPPLFFCAWDTVPPTGVNKFWVGPMRATRTEDTLPGGAVLGVWTSVECPLPPAAEAHTMLTTGGAGVAATLSLSVYHYATSGEDSLGLPFAGMAGGDQVSFPLPPAPLPPSPPPASPPPGIPGHPDCSTATADGETTILKADGSTYTALCDMSTKGGGWALAAVVTAGGTSWTITDANGNQGDSSSAWESAGIFGSLDALTSDFKSEAWNSMPKSQIMVLYTGNSLTNNFLLKAISCHAGETMRETFQGLQFSAAGSASFSASEPGAAHRCTIDDSTSTNDQALSMGGTMNTLTLKWGEYEGAQDNNKDRAMFSTNRRTAVDAPSGLGSFAQIGSDTSVNVGINNDNAVSASGTHIYRIYIK